MRIVVAIPIWGSGYVDRFLRYALPSLRAPGNLPALAAGGELEVVLYTDGVGAHRLAPAMIESGLPHRFAVMAPNVEEPPFAGCHGGTMMKQLFQHGFDLAWERQAAFVPVCADAVYSDRFFASALRIVEGGKRCAMTQGGGVNVATIGPVLEAMMCDGVMNAPPRRLMAEFLRAVEYGVHLPTWPGTQLYPAQMFWPFGRHGAVMRVCHCYPAMLFAQRHAVMRYSPDNDLAELTLGSPDEIGWMNDSDLGFFFGLAEPGHASLEEAKPAGDTSLENFCRQWMSPWKARYFEQRICWHDDDEMADSQHAVAASDAVIEHIMSTYHAVGGTLA